MREQESVPRLVKRQAGEWFRLKRLPWTDTCPAPEDREAACVRNQTCMEKLEFTDDDGNMESWYVLDETRLGGKTYLLVTDSEDGDGEAMILKDESSDGDPEADFCPVEDPDELAGAGQIFSEILKEHGITIQ